MTFPKILVAGFANSGTSFMCELVAAMGFSAGSPVNLKRADGHNPHGYWEHLPLRNAIWGRVGNFDERRIPGQPVNPSRWPAATSIIQDIAEQDGVEVYKDCTGPWSYPLLPGVEKVVLMRRDLDTLYEKYYKHKRWPRQEIARVHTAYYDLAAKFMASDLPMLWMFYEDFLGDAEWAVKQVCEFLGQPYDARLLRIFRPRPS